MRKYEYSVLRVVDTLHGAVIGSGDGMSKCEMLELVEWLEWRLTTGWDSSCSVYDDAVRVLGTLAAAEARAYLLNHE